MPHAKLSNIHILQGTLPTYLNIHTYLQSIFVTYLLHLNDIFAICSHFIHTYGHTPERQLHAMYVHTYLHSFGKNNFMLHIHWKGNFCITNSHIYFFERQFHVIYSYFEEHFRAIFNIHAHSQSTWLPTLYTHVHGEQHFHTI